MASSFTAFRGVGFWSNDEQIEAWLALLTQEISRLIDPPEWLRDLQTEWVEQATVHGGGIVSSLLDEFATSDDRIGVLLSISAEALQRLEAAPPLITVTINDYRGEPDEVWGSFDKRWVQCVGDAFVALLKGLIHTTAATSPKVIPRGAP